jgi:hypothetical protein
MNGQIKHLLRYTNQDENWNQQLRDMAKQCGIATCWSYSREMTMPVNYKSIEQFAHLIVDRIASKLENDGMVEVASEVKDMFKEQV